MKKQIFDERGVLAHEVDDGQPEREPPVRLQRVVMRLRRAHWWCGACNWHGQTEDSVGANDAGKICCPKCGNTDVREKGSPLFKAA